MDPICIHLRFGFFLSVLDFAFISGSSDLYRERPRPRRPLRNARRSCGPKKPWAIVWDHFMVNRSIIGIRSEALH
jgi:hypothetical protein